MKAHLVRVLLVIGVFMGHLAGPSHAGCLIFCDSASMSPANARSYLTAALGAPLPAGLAVVAMQEGGFQDTFIEAELAGPKDAIEAALRLMAIDPAALVAVDAAGFGAAAEPVWSLRPGMDLRGAEGKLGHFASARAAVTTAPDVDGHLRLFIFAFET